MDIELAEVKEEVDQSVSVLVDPFIDIVEHSVFTSEFKQEEPESNVEENPDSVRNEEEENLLATEIGATPLKRTSETFLVKTELLEENCKSNDYIIGCKRKEEQDVSQHPGPKQKSSKLVFTDLQRRTLETIVKETERPSEEMLVTIAQSLGLEPTTVCNFFMDARMRRMDKRKNDNPPEEVKATIIEDSSAIIHTKRTTETTSVKTELLDDNCKPDDSSESQHLNLTSHTTDSKALEEPTVKYESEYLPYLSDDECDTSPISSKQITDTRTNHNTDVCYTCDTCEKTFNTKNRFKSHIMSHLGVKPYDCFECEMSFTRSGILKRQMKTHTGEKPYTHTTDNKTLEEQTVNHEIENLPYLSDDECDSSPCFSETNTDSITNHNTDLCYTCDRCGKTFKTKNSIKLHIISHLGEKSYTCGECNMSFTRAGNLKTHLRTHTREMPYRCFECNRSFNQLGHLKTHMRTHTGEKPYTCAECKASFSRLDSLKKHMRTHTGEKPYTCTECKASFSRLDSLKTHMRTHTGEKPYTCTECKASFSNSGNLKTHMRTHRGEKPYTCTKCKVSFPKSCHLKIHMRTHIGEKPYTCAECKASFSKSDHLKTHMRTHTGEKPYRCSECNRSFNKLGNLKRHMRTHTGEKPYTCAECKASFSNSGNLKTHMRTHTGEMPYTCTNCHVSFTQSSHLKRHRLSHR